MLQFRPYQHIEKFGTSEVEGIEDGVCSIFPKIDGTNSSVWLHYDKLCAGSRKRELTLESDNAGFYKQILENENVRRLLDDNPDLRLYGEFLVPHTIKTYKEDAWREFYVFDVVREKNLADKVVFEMTYLDYEEYSVLLEKYDIKYIPRIAKLLNPTYEQLLDLQKTNTYLINDGSGEGEGLVIKNYDFINRYGRRTWAKIVTEKFKLKHRPVKDKKEINNESIEFQILEKYVTEILIEKEYAKIVNENDGWRSKDIPRLLSTVWHELIIEETWNILKKYKNPKINFRTLQTMTFNKIKELKKELF